MLRPDTTLGCYRLISQIGAGGMGEVWKAEDTRLGRFVAIKILPPEMTSESIARLRREARMAAQLNHPNIATVYAFEEASGRLFIVMELVDGEPLSQMIKRGIPEAQLLRIGRAVAEALAEAHAKGVIHRDIKPENIMVSGTRVKVLDFGIAKWLAPAASDDSVTMSLLTQQGIVIGTVPYMSPEQALGKPLDPRSDILRIAISGRDQHRHDDADHSRRSDRALAHQCEDFAGTQQHHSALPAEESGRATCNGCRSGQRTRSAFDCKN